MFYTLAAAAKASGLGASAIRTAIERGQIAAIKDLFDEWQVEDSELHRLYFPVGPGTAKRNEGSSTSFPSGTRLERQIGAQPQEAGPALRRGCDAAAPESGDADHGEATGGSASGRPGTVPCLPAGAENDATDVERSPLASQQCVALLEERSGTDRHETQDARLQLSALDHTDRIAIGNALFWESEIRVDGRHETMDSALRPLPNRRPVIVLTGALLVAFCTGWIGGLGTYHLFGHSLVSVLNENRTYSSAPSGNQVAAAEKERRDLAAGALVTGKIAPPAVAENRARRRYSSTQGIPQAPETRPSKFASLTRQNSAEAALDNTGDSSVAGAPYATNSFSRRIPVPETKPTTVEGWTVRSVYNGTVILEGPGGVWTAARGDTVPGLGRVNSIVLWGSRWIVATTRGLVTTP